MNTGVMTMTVALLVLLSLKLPVFVAILDVLAVYFMLTPDINPAVFAQQAITKAESVTLFIVPFFVYAGALMNYTGMTKRVMDFYMVSTGRMYGELSQVNILLSMLMGGLSGPALADAVMETKMLIPETRKERIDRAFSTVVTAVSSMITLLVPPGIGLILYGCVANASIDKLFVAGFGPGVLLRAAIVFMVSRTSKGRGYLPLCTEKMHPSMFWKSLQSAALLLCLPVITIGGVCLGVFMATKAGSVAVVYAAILGIVYRGLGFREIAQGLKETLQATSSIILIVVAVSTLPWILIEEIIPQRSMEWMIQMISNKWIFLVAVDVFLIFVGMFVEGNASMIVLVPLFAPAAVAYGIDPIHFVMVFIFANAIGVFTPPMGTLIFVTCGVIKYPARDFIKGVAPFYAFLLGCLLVLTSVPLFSTGPAGLVY